MRNFLAEGRTISLIAPAGGVTAGVPVIVGDVFAIPLATASAGASFVGYVEGVYTIAKATGFTAAAGDSAYWNATSLNLTNDTADELIGVYYVAAGSSDATASIRLNGTSLQDSGSTTGGVLTTGYVTCTGINNVSSVPTTFTYYVGSLVDGQTITGVSLYGTYADDVADDISGATYTIIVSEDGSDTTLDEFTNPGDVINEDELDPAYSVSGDEISVRVEVSGLADSSVVIFKVDCPIA